MNNFHWFNSSVCVHSHIMRTFLQWNPNSWCSNFWCLNFRCSNSSSKVPSKSRQMWRCLCFWPFDWEQSNCPNVLCRLLALIAYAIRTSMSVVEEYKCEDFGCSRWLSNKWDFRPMQSIDKCTTPKWWQKSSDSIHSMAINRVRQRFGLIQMDRTICIDIWPFAERLSHCSLSNRRYFLCAIKLKTDLTLMKYQ